MKRLLFCLIASASLSAVHAQSYKETFDTNSLEWIECGSKNSQGMAVIEKGVMTVTSKGEKKGLSALATMASGTATKVGENTFFETHCYAPLDVMKPFKLRTNVNVKQLAEDRLVGLVFNYRDGGTFYCFSFNDEFVRFERRVDGELVGVIQQGIKWKGKRKTDMVWELESDGQTLTFRVDGAKLMTIRYMPLSYSGVGFYAFGNQSLVVDEIDFLQ